MKLQLGLLALSFLAFTAHAAVIEDELNPYAENISQILDENEALYEKGELGAPKMSSLAKGYQCFRETCAAFLEVNKSTQRARLFINGVQIDGPEWKVTTGMAGHRTPNFDQAFEYEADGTFRSYKGRYSSTKFPGGDYKGLGNMPYATFIRAGKGWAVHGTTPGNILKLGTVPLSHGCVRVHPDKAKIFGNVARTVRPENTWIWVHD